MRNILLAHNACINAGYDVNLVRSGLAAAGYSIVHDPTEADEVIFSACSVRETWVVDAARQINMVLEKKPTIKVIISGCAARTSTRELAYLINTDSIEFTSDEELLRQRTHSSIHELDRLLHQGSDVDFESNLNIGIQQARLRLHPEKVAIASALAEIDKTHNLTLEHEYKRSTKGFVFYHESESSEFITVSRGCLYQCSFCSIPTGRGRFTSVPIHDICQKVKIAHGLGTRKFVLLGDEIGNYGSDIGDVCLSDLLSVFFTIDKMSRVSIRYIEPIPFMRHFEYINRACREGRIDLLYISLQHGSQNVLKDMNRNYPVQPVVDMLRSIRENSKTVIYTNWMSGFPTESHDDHEMTIRAMKSLNAQINVAIPYSPRPGTPSAKMVQIPTELIDQRSNDISSVAATMKASQFSALMRVVHPDLSMPLIERIRIAELNQYHES